MPRFYRFVWIPFLLFFGSCEPKNEVEMCVYHWATDFNLSNEQADFLKEQEVNKVYTKFFDLVVNENDEVIPVAQVIFEDPPIQTIVPVVYITTKVFTVLDSVGIEKLAGQTDQLIKELNPGEVPQEVQIDCDWMSSIQDKYFYFLKLMKGKTETCDLSCTIRLYQYKYPELSGVPPVDKGLLMYYNMGDLTDYNERNSILNNDIGKEYLGFGKYPLPLDFALPNFSWSLVFRYGEFKGILGSLDYQSLQDTNIFKPISSGHYLVQHDTTISGTYLRYGDEIRYENCEESELVEAAKLLKSEKNQEKTKLIFYDLKKTIHHEKDKILNVFAAFE